MFCDVCAVVSYFWDLMIYCSLITYPALLIRQRTKLESHLHKLEVLQLADRYQKRTLKKSKKYKLLVFFNFITLSTSQGNFSMLSTI